MQIADDENSKFTFVCGGSIGSEPYSHKTWSGICFYLLQAMDHAGILDHAVGIEVPGLHDRYFLAKNFNRKHAVWHSHYNFDPAYRRALTQAAKQISVASPFMMQIGHMFSLPEALPEKKCFSYNDGNLPEKLKSGIGLEGVSSKRIDQALRYDEQTAGEMTAIFTFSEYLRQSFISDFHVPAERVFNVGAGINFTSKDCPPPNPYKDHSAPRVLFIGVDFVRKGGPLLLQAFRIVRETLPAAELHIVGPKKIPAVPPGVVFHGRLSKADPAQKQKLESLLRGSSLFVLPSLYEPFGIAPLEAMLYQLPCLVTDAWAFRETVSAGVNGDRVAKGSVDDLAAKLLELLTNPEQLAVMGTQGRDLVLRKYTWSAVANRMSDAMSHVLGRSEQSVASR
jgi:alpha-maltose-1-phosphate synthase